MWFVLVFVTLCAAGFLVLAVVYKGKYEETLEAALEAIAEMQSDTEENLTIMSRLQGENEVLRGLNATKDANYIALEQGMTELGESYEAQLLDAHDLNYAKVQVIEDLSADRLVLFRAAERCHENCLPMVHHDVVEMAAAEVLERMRERYNET